MAVLGLAYFMVALLLGVFYFAFNRSLQTGTNTTNNLNKLAVSK